MIDYSKPGKTAPGTKHAAPPRRAPKTWQDFVGPAEGYAPKADVELPETVEITVPTGTTEGTRRERRAAGVGVVLESAEVPMEQALTIRAMRRAQDRYRARRQRKGQRRFYENQRLEAVRQDKVRGQLHVLSTRAEGDPLFDNVAAAVAHQYRDVAA